MLIKASGLGFGLMFFCSSRLCFCFYTRKHFPIQLLSQAKPPCSFTKEETGYLTKRIQDGVTEVVQAYAAVKFADRYLRGLRGDVDIVDCAFVESRVTELPFFATQVRLGHTGVEEIYQLGPLNEYESLKRGGVDGLAMLK